jgi:predicted nuclease of predicted toxin-antitoxin system
MTTLLVDEDLPRSLLRALRESGFTAEDVRDVGLKGKHDDSIFAYAVSHRRLLLSADLSFGNLRRFPLGTHAGILVARFANEVSTHFLNDAIVRALQDLSEDELSGNLIILEPGRIRLRRKK